MTNQQKTNQRKINQEEQPGKTTERSNAMNEHDATGADGKDESRDWDYDDASADVVRQKLLDALTPGFQAEFDPDEADVAGAFVEDALSEEDAAESSIDAFLDAKPDLMAATMPVAANDGEF